MNSFDYARSTSSRYVSLLRREAPNVETVATQIAARSASVSSPSVSLIGFPCMLLARPA